jgi:hypothetical protein
MRGHGLIMRALLWPSTRFWYLSTKTMTWISYLCFKICYERYHVLRISRIKMSGTSSYLSKDCKKNLCIAVFF